MSFPACFPTHAQYREWRKVAIIAKESVTPCTDCTRPYKAHMTDQGKCFPSEVRMQFSLVRRFDPPLTEGQT